MTDDPVAKLEAIIATAQAELAALKAQRPVPPTRPPRDEGPRVVILNDERTDGLPNLKEMEKLYAAVKSMAPWPLNDKYDEHKPFRGFCACFRWIANKHRTEFPNPKFALSFWLDNCKTWLRERNGMANDVSANELILAVFAFGDVRYVPANAQLGLTWELALAEYIGRPASPDAWQMVMKNGASAILPPSSPARRMPPLSPVRIYGG
jgi:hypothetical protein